MPSHAEVIEIFDIQKTDLEGAFSLVNELGDTGAVIDCSSFINNMSIELENGSYTYYLSQQECVSDLEYLMKTSPENRRCLNFDDSKYLINDCR